MRGIEPSEVKDKLVDILSNIDEFCGEHGLRYCLAYGTLLGAIRHQGFIPWDDDIDIWMPRPDYEWFYRHYDDPVYKFHSMETDRNWPLNFGKVCDERYTAVDEFGKDFGLYVDVFPLDGVPDEDRVFQKQLKRVRRKERIWSNLVITSRMSYESTMPMQKKIKWLLSRIAKCIVPTKVAIRRLVKETSRYDFEGAQRFCSITDSNYAIPKDKLTEIIRVPFEKKSFNVPACYDYWLKLFYDDYMQLPPIEQRINHGIKVFEK